MEQNELDAILATHAEEEVPAEAIDVAFAAAVLCVGFNRAYPGIFAGITGKDDEETLYLVADAAQHSETVKQIEAGLSEKCVRVLQRSENPEDTATQVLLTGEPLSDEPGSDRWLNRQVLIEGIARGLRRMTGLKAAKQRGLETAELAMCMGLADEVYRFSQPAGALMQIELIEGEAAEVARAFAAMGNLKIVAATPEILENTVTEDNLLSMLGLPTFPNSDSQD